MMTMTAGSSASANRPFRCPWSIKLLLLASFLALYVPIHGQVKLGCVRLAYFVIGLSNACTI